MLVFEWMESAVRASLEKSVCADNNVVKAGAEELTQLLRHDQLRFLQALLNIIQSKGDTETATFAATIYLKNIVKSTWDQRADLNLGLNQHSRQLLQEQIPSLIFLVKDSKPLRSFLLEIILVMASTDFPFEWPSLLPFLMNKYYLPFLQAHSQPGASTENVTLEDVDLAIEIMLTALQKYETAESSSAILCDLKAILEAAQAPLTSTFLLSTRSYVEQTAGGQENSSLGLSSVTLVGRMTLNSLKIITALHGVDLPEFFEEHLKELVTAIMTLFMLNVQNPDVGGPTDDDAPSLHDEIRTACTQFCYEYVTKYSEEFMAYVVDVTRAILSMLQTCTQAGSQDSLVASGMSYLAMTAGVVWGPECDPFKVLPDLLKVICTDVILKVSAQTNMCAFTRQGAVHAHIYDMYAHIYVCACTHPLHGHTGWTHAERGGPRRGLGGVGRRSSDIYPPGVGGCAEGSPS